MRILLVEDEERNIQSALIQFPNDEITIARSCTEAMEKLGRGSPVTEVRYDLVLTDMNIPLGEGQFDVNRTHASSDIFPGGIAVLLRAISDGIPCLMVTDANGHRDVTGLMLEQVVFPTLQAGKDGKLLGKIVTRPCWIATSTGNGKDWKAVLQDFEALKARLSRVSSGK